MFKKRISLFLAILIFFGTFSFQPKTVYSMDFDNLMDNILPKDDSYVKNDPEYIRLCNIIDGLYSAPDKAIFLFHFIVDPKRALSDYFENEIENKKSEIVKRALDPQYGNETQRVYRSLNNIFISTYNEGYIDKKDIGGYLGILTNGGELKERLKQAVGYLFSLLHQAETVLWPEIQKDIDSLFDPNADTVIVHENGEKNENNPKTKPNTPKENIENIKITGYKSDNITNEALKKLESNMDDELLKSYGLDNIDKKQFAENETLRNETYNKLTALGNELVDAKTSQDFRRVENKFIKLRDGLTSKKEYVTKYDKELNVPKLEEKINHTTVAGNPIDSNKIDKLPIIESFGKLDNPGDFKITKKIEKIENKLNEYKVSYKVENHHIEKKNSKKVNITILLDRSGSMRDKDKWQKAKKCAIDFINNIYALENENVYIGVLPFDDGLIISRIKPQNYHGKDDLIKYINNISLGMGTNFSSPLIEEAYNINTNENNFILLLSDGEPTEDGCGLRNPSALLKNNPEKFNIYYDSLDEKKYRVNDKIEFKDLDPKIINYWYYFSERQKDEISGKDVRLTIYPSKFNGIHYYYETLAISDHIKNVLNTKIYTISLENETQEADKFLEKIASENCAYAIEDSNKLKDAFNNIESNIKQNINKPILQEKLNSNYVVDPNTIRNNSGLVDYNLKDNLVNLKVEDLNKIDESNPNIRYGEFSYTVKLNDKNFANADNSISNIPLYDYSRIVADKDTNNVIFNFEPVSTKPTILTLTTLYFDQNNKPYLEKNIPVTVKSDLGQVDFRAYDGHSRYLDLEGKSYNFSNPIKNFKNSLVIKPFDNSDEIKITDDLSNVKLPCDEKGNVKNAHLYYISHRITPIFEGTNLEDPLRKGYARYVFKVQDKDIDKLKLYSNYRGTKLLNENLDFVGQSVIYYDVLKSINFNTIPIPSAILNNKEIIPENILKNKWDKEFPTIAENDKTFNFIYDSKKTEEEIENKIKITFDGGEHGKFEENAKTVFEVKSNEKYDLTNNAPKVIANKDYEFVSWDKELTGTSDKDVVIKAVYKEKSTGKIIKDEINHSDIVVETYPVKTVVSKDSNNLNKVERVHYYTFKIDKKEYKEYKNSDVSTHKMDVAPYIKNDRTMIPLRFVAEAIGAEVYWDNDTRTASFIKDGITAKIQIDGNKIVLSNGKEIVMDAKPDNINDRILVSLTNVSKVFNISNGNVNDGIRQDIEWNGKDRTITIYVK